MQNLPQGRSQPLSVRGLQNSQPDIPSPHVWHVACDMLHPLLSAVKFAINKSLLMIAP